MTDTEDTTRIAPATGSPTGSGNPTGEDAATMRDGRTMATSPGAGSAIRAPATDAGPIHASMSSNVETRDPGVREARKAVGTRAPLIADGIPATAATTAGAVSAISANPPVMGAAARHGIGVT